MTDDVRDITIIGAGPVGLSTAFWAGMRQATSQIVDSLPEIGGQCTTLYPEKWIFDVPGHTRVLANDLVAQLREQSLGQFDVPVHLETTAHRISWDDEVVTLHTNSPTHPTLRSQCVNMPRPCLYVSCRHHLYLDVNIKKYYYK